ncbi:MAG: hypothetical protein RLZZ230_346 [Candidatus Parcubacteria bacterium]|jgi:hypothetical protein
MFRPYFCCDILTVLFNSEIHLTFCMAEEQQQDGQKTLVAFVVGLLIGGMLVWAFSGPTADAPTTQKTDDKAAEGTKNTEEGNKDFDTTTEAGKGQEASAVNALPKLQVGDGKVNVEDQKASKTIELSSATYPVSEGWIGVREYNDEKLGYILGVARFSEEQGLVPSEISLLRSTTAGRTYAIVIFKEDGDRKFNLAGDAQIDTVFDTFQAQ